MLKCEAIEDIHQFLNLAEDFMLQNESENNLILGLADAMKYKRRKFTAPLHYLVFQGDEVIGAALRTDEHRPLSLTRMPREATVQLVEKINDQKVQLKACVGESESSQRFAKSYSHQPTLNMHQGVYEAHQIQIPAYKDLDLVVASEDHGEVVKSFLSSFIHDCFALEKNSEREVEEMTERHLENKTLYLLKNNEQQFVSMAANNRQTKNSACVSLVYTPNEYRNKGYGALVTALVSQKMLDEGKKFCNLFTDLTNPTSNSIYQKIGYMKIGESKHYHFN